MHFKNPEILYFLFALILPILVHLFQLRKFKIEYFSNLKFLKELTIQTRKSSKLKKYLLLASRLLLLTFLILAFAQPFFKAKDSENKNNELVLVLDNSFSMQAKGSKGELLKRAVQEVLENTPKNTNLSILTNQENFWDTTLENCQSDLQKLNYSGIPFSIENVFMQLKARKSFNNRDIVFLTDGIGVTQKAFENKAKNDNVYFLKSIAEKFENASIDSVFLSQNLNDFYEIEVRFSSNFETPKNIPITIKNNNTVIAKTVLAFHNSKTKKVFTLPKTNFNGVIQLEDNALHFDNTYYFSITKPSQIKILSIGETTKSNFLERIYTQPEFKFENQEFSSINYQNLQKNDVIVLNELENYPIALQTNLKDFVEKGGNLICIPSEKNNIEIFNEFLKKITPIQFSETTSIEKKVTQINFSDPLFTNVFEKKVSNFQYPSVKKSFLSAKNAIKVLQFNDQSAFLQACYKPISAVYVFHAALNKINSNFQNSPLIVPTFYKMAINAEKTGVKAETIGSGKSVLIETENPITEVVSIENEIEKFIPTQQLISNKIKINANDLPNLAGNYSVKNKTTFIDNISYNYNRSESNLTPTFTKLPTEVESITSLETFFEINQKERTENSIWKWFLMLTFLFLIVELAIQKFVK